MLNKSTAIFLIVLIGLLATTVAGHWKNKEHHVLPGIHHHLLGTRGERCPQGTRLVFSSNSPGLLTRNFAARCEPSNIGIASPFKSSSSLIHSKTALDVMPNFPQQSSEALQPTDIFRPFPFLTSGVIGHQSKGFSHRVALPTGLLLKERALHKTVGSKLSRRAMKHSLNKSKF